MAIEFTKGVIEKLWCGRDLLMLSRTRDLHVIVTDRDLAGSCTSFTTLFLLSSSLVNTQEVSHP